MGEENKKPCLDAAKEYLSYGWSPIPIRPKEKKPAGLNGDGKWEEFQSKRAKQSELNQAWAQTPTLNVGVVMGAISGIVSIDVDTLEGEEELYELSAGVLPPTVTFNTGRDDSYRYIYKLPMGHPAPTVTISDRLKILGNGAQSVMPPSTHPCGDKYCWVVDRSPTQITIVTAPDWLLTILSQHHEGKRTSGKVGTGDSKQRHVGDGETIKEGGRESTLVTLAGAIRRFGATKYEIYEMLKAANIRCDPPLPDHDLQRIARSVSNYQPTSVPPTPQLIQRATVIAGANVVRIADVQEEPLFWLWPSWMPLGGLVCVDGDGGVGKSTMLVDIASRITNGWPMPDGSRPTGFSGPQNAMMIACEDMLNQVIKPRVTAANADEKRMFYLETVTDIALKKPRQIEFPSDAETLGKVVGDNNIKFLFIDPILAFMSGNNDYSRDQDVRHVLSPLKEIAEQHQCTIVYLRHWNKGGAGGKASYRGGGSLAFVNAARAAMLVGRNPENENQSVLAFFKGNLSRKPQSLVFETVPVPKKDGICWVRWIGYSRYSDQDIVQHSDVKNQQYGSDEKASLEEAMAFIKEVLKSRDITVKDMQKEAKNAGIGWRTVERAKAELNFKSFKTNGQWYWPQWVETNKALPATATGAVMEQTEAQPEECQHEKPNEEET